MTEQVVDLDSPESPEAEAEATPQVDETTWKKRLAGKDQALTRAQQEKAEAARERDEYRQKLAEYERANESETDRLRRELEEAKAEAAQARREAEQREIAAQYPSYAKFLSDTADFTEKDRAAAFEKWAARQQRNDEETETEPRIDANNPRRTPLRLPQAPTRDELRENVDKAFRFDIAARS